MPTPADQRLLELLDKWQRSLELHARYSSLDDESYLQVQPWPEHQRPNRWIIDLAGQKTAALRKLVEERMALGDVRFSDALELMIFLANLVGSEHIERFIPLATADVGRDGEAPATQTTAETTRELPAAAASAVTGTREMPAFVESKRFSPPPAGTAEVARAERTVAAGGEPTAKAPTGPAAKPTGPLKRAGRHTPRPAAAPANPPSEGLREQVIADATRLVQWGRKWYELPELIARMADRPALSEVRRILKDNKSLIEKKSAEP